MGFLLSAEFATPTKETIEITKADIAASDDLTGKGGDWELEKQFGLIGEEELKVKNYNHALGSLSTTGVLSGSGVTHIDSNVTMMNSGNVGLGASGAYATVGSDFGLAVEELNVSVSNVDNLNKRTSTSAGEVVFDGEIVGIFFDQAKTRAENVDGNTYHSSSLIYAMSGSGGGSNSADSDGGRMPEGKKPSSGMTNFFNSTQSHGSGGIADSSNGSDWVSVSNHGSGTNNLLQFGAQNANSSAGDYIRILVIPNATNTAPAAADNIGTVKEDATLTVSNGATSNSITGASFVDSFDLSSQESNPQGVAFNEDGTKMFIVGRDGDEVNEYTLSTGYDVSTASYDSNFSVASQDTIPQDIVFNADGTKMFILGEGNGAVYAYNLSTGFDVSTASFINNFSVASQENSPQGLAFNNDGTKMFITGGGGRDVNEYTLASAFNTATASFVDSFDISSQDTLPNGLVFNSDGTKMFVTGNQGNDINEYTLSTGFDVSTASFVGNISVSSQDTTPGGIKFNNDGTKLFMVGVAGADINEYTLTTPFSLVNISGEKFSGKSHLANIFKLKSNVINLS